MAKYLDNDGLLYFWQKIKTIFAFKTELPTKLSDLTNDGNFVTDASYVHTDNNFTTTLKNKLNGIATGAEVNVQADWNVTDSSSDAFIKNKPTIPEGVVVDDELSNTSTNPVQNKIIYSALGGKVDVVSGKGLSTNDYTTTEKNKLAGIATGAEVNQNAFTNVKVGTSTISADAKTDTLTLTAGTNITLTPDTSADSVTIATSAEVNQNAFSNVKVGSTTIAADSKTDTLELVAGSNVTITPDATNDKVTIAATDTTYSDATQSAHGLMSVNDKKKLDAFGAASTYALKTDISGMYKFKGSVATASALPTTGQTVGDVYNIEAASTYGGAGMNVAWDGEAWDPLGEIFSISSITNSEIDTIVAA